MEMTDNCDCWREWLTIPTPMPILDTVSWKSVTGIDNSDVASRVAKSAIVKFMLHFYDVASIPDINGETATKNDILAGLANFKKTFYYTYPNYKEWQQHHICNLGIANRSQPYSKFFNSCGAQIYRKKEVTLKRKAEDLDINTNDNSIQDGSNSSKSTRIDLDERISFSTLLNLDSLKRNLNSDYWRKWLTTPTPLPSNMGKDAEDALNGVNKTMEASKKARKAITDHMWNFLHSSKAECGGELPSNTTIKFCLSNFKKTLYYSYPNYIEWDHRYLHNIGYSNKTQPFTKFFGSCAPILYQRRAAAKTRKAEVHKYHPCHHPPSPLSSIGSLESFDVFKLRLSGKLDANKLP